MQVASVVLQYLLTVRYVYSVCGRGVWVCVCVCVGGCVDVGGCV